MFQVKNAIALTLSVTSIVYGHGNGATRVNTSSVAGGPVQATKVHDSKKQALRLFDELLESADVFADPEVRTIVQARIADLLWEHDPSRARSLITAAFHATAEIGRAPGGVGTSPYRVREEMVSIVSRRDLSLALELVETAVDRPPKDDPKFWDTGNGSYSEQAMLYRGLASCAGSSNPTIVARIARMFIDRGHLEFGLGAVGSLLPENVDLARDLLAQALAVAGRDNPRALWNIRSLGSFMFPTFGNGTERFATGELDPRRTQPAFPELVPSFLEFAYDVIAQLVKPTQAINGADGLPGTYSISDLGVARMMMPFFEQYMPQKAAILKPRLTEAVRVANVNASASPHGDTGNAVKLLTVQEMLEAAKRTQNPDERNHLYYQAAYRTTMNHQLDQAKEIAAKITHVPSRSLIDRYIQRIEEEKRNKAATEALYRRDIDNSYRLINELTDIRVRADLLGAVALALVERKETARAARVIGEAQRLILTTEISMVRAKDQLRLASVAAQVDLDRGFDDLRAAVVTINSAQMPTQWTKITSGALFESKDGGLGFLVPGLDQGFAIFGDADFDRALQVARGIEMNEVSVLAQLAVCRGALKGYRL